MNNSSKKLSLLVIKEQTFCFNFDYESCITNRIIENRERQTMLTEETSNKDAELIQ
jgi:hypothetical protein